MKLDDTLRERLAIIKSASLAMAAHIASAADQAQVQSLVDHLPNLKYSSSLLFAAFLLHHMGNDMKNDPDRPKDMPPDLILPILAASILNLAEHMQIIEPPSNPMDIN